MAQDRASQQGPAEFGSDNSSLTEAISGVLSQTVTSLNDQLVQLTQGISYLTPASEMQAQALLANSGLAITPASDLTDAAIKAVRMAGA